MRALVAIQQVADLLYTAEQLHAELLAAGLLISAASQSEVVSDLRFRVREEKEQ